MTTNQAVWIGTSWKMTKTLAEARAFVDRLTSEPIPAGVQAFVLPAHTALATVRDRLPANSPILLGAQNAHWAPEGAGTGEISMRMARDAGAALVELGHSERRAHFGETDDTVAAKTRAALDADLLALVCVGESAAERERGDAESVVAAQLTAALARVAADEIGRVLIAYEPVWAIGDGGRTARSDELAPVLRVVRDTLDDLGRGRSAGAVLYGGSVTVEGAPELLAVPGVDGLFVGRAGWEASEFRRLLEIGADHARRRRPSSLRSTSARTGAPLLTATRPLSRSTS